MRDKTRLALTLSVAVLALAFLATGFASSCGIKQSASLTEAKEVRLIYSSDVLGEIEPCG